MTDAAVGDAERTPGQRAGVSRPTLHLNVDLNLAEEEEQKWWMNMEKLSPSLGFPPPEPCELLEAPPENPPPLLLQQQTDGIPPDWRSCRHLQPHAAKRAFLPVS